MKSIQVYTFIILVFSFYQCTTLPEQKHLVAFYNLENLFDTINDPGIWDGEFTPEGSKKWDTQKYTSKINNMSKVIAQIGEDIELNAPDIIGLCEVENRQVIHDLIKTTPLKKFNFEIIHKDSPDKRGIDVALLYKKTAFKEICSSWHPLNIYDADSGNRIHTRDQLLVTGILKKDTIHIIVNHWPSRYGGKQRSIPHRKAAASLNRSIIDSLLRINAKAKILTMGDFNDNPNDQSIITFLNAQANCNFSSHYELYNPLAKTYKQGMGTLYYRGGWDLFDQIIISESLCKNKGKGLQMDTAGIFNKPFLIQQNGKFKGNLHRTYGGKTYLNGYSDHLPVYMVLKARE
ncbi:endonuclease/exonuclease/phosphatase family protein [Plebeiibacterium marinum]|uniref:Endonuclease/exonuclease/phosphatase family protein n=1 Tax=Plebeiibacterium marinum TaxID=2992111 RepID=A0AAE3MG92_9BACT|nr:endonuclease/exonuclease/phosphatase family protein [Plebeiobacterium marinum]MCW3807087.1 endonuclease/exonuclease/phosphatase family protein [Plebeiobacterium marinum]